MRENHTPTPHMHLRGISKRFGGITALDQVDFDLRLGEVHGLIGENGAGKSSMMKLLAGVYQADSGEMLLDGAAMRFDSPAEAQARGVGMVYQELSAFEHLTVAENIFSRNLPVRNGLVDWRGMNRQAQDHINELDLDIDVTQTMGSMSVGNQQLIEIARVIFSGARIIILDEPTSALSAPETRRLFRFIDTLKHQGKTIIFISHFLEDVLEVADRITILKNGRSVAVLEAQATTKQQLVKLMIGIDASILKQVYVQASAGTHTDHAASTIALEVRQASRRGAFRDISFAVHTGEIVGLFGFMGAGQIQLARCMFGAEHLDSGSVALNGRALRLRNTTQARRAGIAYVPEDRRNSLMLQQAIYKNITLAHLSKLVRVLFNQRAEIAIANTQIAELNIRPPRPLLSAGALSGGNQQKVVLAKWLTRRPKALILNEPTRGMDVGAKDDVLNIVRRLRDDGVAILLITTEPETILSLADRALVMCKGRISAELGGPELSKEQMMKHA